MVPQILILDFGSQYTQLIARRVRELNVYCEIHPFDYLPTSFEGIKGVILSGSPCSVYDESAPRTKIDIFNLPVPVLGLCYGAQLMSYLSGGKVEKSDTREYGRANLQSVAEGVSLLKGVSVGSQVWMSHGDTITALPENAEIIAGTSQVKVAGFKFKDKNIFGLQFHPEVVHSTDGAQMLGNFLYQICACRKDWEPGSFINQTVADLQATLGDDEVILGLSGGVDSSVAAALLNKAIGSKLHCLFIDNGLLRKGEFEEVLAQYLALGFNVEGVDASARFYSELAGVTDPETKRKIIGRVFIEVFDEHAHKLKGIKWLGQGTIYPDVIESVSVKGPSATIKSHHNVGGLPDKMKMKVVEPLRMLFKDEVRRVGAELGLSDVILGRHPFPGPGLAIRILGEVSAERVAVLQKADRIYVDKLKEHQLYDKVWQAGAILLPVRSVGVMGDERTYEEVIALRAVTSVDGMTADWAYLPHEFLAEVSSEIINKVRGVNRVVYDISSKPPATIEWE